MLVANTFYSVKVYISKRWNNKYQLVPTEK